MKWYHIDGLFSIFDSYTVDIMTIGTLYLVATPIGNIEDITIRAIKTLFAVDIIACEDTKRTGLLLHLLRVEFPQVIPAENMERKPQLVQHHSHNEMNAAAKLLSSLQDGYSVALVTDAGMPLISDPGYALIQGCIKHDIPVISVPGASSLTAALSVSGLPATHVFFAGFPPEKPEKIRQQLERMKAMSTKKPTITVVHFISPHKIDQFISIHRAVFGPTEITVVRELTKVHEEVLRISTDAYSHEIEHLKGEIVLLYRI